MAVSISPPDVSSLLRHYNLTEDACIQQISAVHLEEISRSHCKDWRKLPAHLDLPEIVASDIDRKQVEESEKRTEFFSGWKEKKGLAATYKGLISALLKIDCSNDAECVCELLAEASPISSSDPTTSTSGASLSPLTENKFPFLNAESMTEGEKERLITRLTRESAEMQNKFAILVDRTKESLEIKKVSPKDLIVLITHSEKSELTKLFKKHRRITKLFCQLKEYWSFFDYELLCLIIDRHCLELKPELNDYEVCFKTYCRRRISELPSDVFKTKTEHKNNLYVKTDQTFDKLTVAGVKNLEYNLSKLFNTDLYLLSIEEGCVQLQFKSGCNLCKVFPLDSKKYKQLRKIGVTEANFYESKTPSECIFDWNHPIPPHSTIKDGSEDNSSCADSAYGTMSLASEMTETIVPKRHSKERLAHPRDNLRGLDTVREEDEEASDSVAPFKNQYLAQHRVLLALSSSQYQDTKLRDQLADKDLHTRMEGAKALNKILSSQIVSDAQMERYANKETLLKFVTKGLKKFQGNDRCTLAKLAALIVIQVELYCPELLESVHPLGIQLARDHTLQPLERAEIIRMLGLITFVQASDVLEVEPTMQVLEDLFCKSKDHELVVSAAVFSWCLLLSIAPDESIKPLFERTLPVFNTLLERKELSVQQEVGVGIALLFEKARESCGDDDVMEWEGSSQVLTKIEELATESNRYISRKDRKQTRSFFRDILHSLEDSTVPEKNMKIGHEVLPLNSWAKLCQYNAFKKLLGSGMNAHLQHNDLLRDVFQMGSDHAQYLLLSKLQTKHVNATIAKHRTKSRSKQRDKRTVDHTYTQSAGPIMEPTQMPTLPPSVTEQPVSYIRWKRGLCSVQCQYQHVCSTCAASTHKAAECPWDTVVTSSEGGTGPNKAAGDTNH